VLQMLERNELHLSAIKLLAPHLTQANHVAVLERARGKSKRAVELIVAELAPKPDVPSVLRKLPANRPSVRATPAARENTPQVTTPLSPGRYKVQFTATQALHDKLQQLKDLMRHQIPDGDLSAIIERAADLLIEQKLKQRFARTKKPRAVARSVQVRESPSRYVPRAVVREVCARDEERCTFVSPEGRRCAALGFLELQHEIPHARGGLPTPENLRILCRAHNALLAERDFGRAFMQYRSSGARRRVGPGTGCNRDP
jgi:hypothetical protein